MFESLGLKSTIIIFLSLILCVAVLQVFMFLTNRSILTHFALSFIALFLTLLLFHMVNIRLKRQKRR